MKKKKNTSAYLLTKHDKQLSPAIDWWIELHVFFFSVFSSILHFVYSEFYIEQHIEQMNIYFYIRKLSRWCFVADSGMHVESFIAQATNSIIFQINDRHKKNTHTDTNSSASFKMKLDSNNRTEPGFWNIKNGIYICNNEHNALLHYCTTVRISM